MAHADQQAIKLGTSGFQLMASAGQAVVNVILQRWTSRPVCVLCGPGNNGGDGFVVARILQDHGWPVRVAMLGTVSQLKHEARQHAELWSGQVEALSPDVIQGAGLIVDALFGTGLCRPLRGGLPELVLALADSDIPVCAIDIPSGVDGSTGQILGAAVSASVTVTFHRKKPGQLLMPGRTLCGELVVADIGIPDAVVREMDVTTHENNPDLWRNQFPWPHPSHHKYSRGHVLIRGGDTMTGAARLTAMAAARSGAGLVSVAVSPSVWPVYAAALTSIMVLPCVDHDAWQALLSDSRRNVVVMGPGAGLDTALRDMVLSALKTSRATVLDADALTVFSEQPDLLFQAIRGPCVLTPHGGEFERLFRSAASAQTAGDSVAGDTDSLLQHSKLERVRAAAHLSGAVVVLKGADTVIAAPDGRAIVNANAPPTLSTGGTGDVLAGIIAGLMAQGMDVFDAAAAAVWMHGRAAGIFGPGLVADDLPTALVSVLHELHDLWDVNHDA